MELYKHNNSGKVYAMICDNAMFKLDGVWMKNLIHYKPLYNNTDSDDFYRTREDFYSSFTKINPEDAEIIHNQNWSVTFGQYCDFCLGWLNKFIELHKGKVNCSIIETVIEEIRKQKANTKHTLY